MSFRPFVPLLILLTLATTLSAKSAYDEEWDHYYDLDIDYFFLPVPNDSAALLHAAIRDHLLGHDDRAIPRLEQLLTGETATGEARQQTAQFLYDRYFHTRAFAAALWLERAEQLGRDEAEILRFLRSHPAPSVSGAGQSAVPFGRYYFQVTINGTPAKVFFDTGAPGLTIDAKWVKKHGWPVDTSRTGRIVEPYIGIEYPTYLTLVSGLRIGDFTFDHLAANAVELTDEQWAKKTSSGIERYDIIMGLDAFYGLVDGVELDYKNGQFVLYKDLPAEENPQPNYMRVEGKPAVTFSLGGERYKAFLDSGSPRHVFTRPMVEQAEVISSFTDSFGNYEYEVSKLKLDHALGEDDLVIEAANYARRSSGKGFDIAAHFGSWMGRGLLYDLRRRRVVLR